ncbi:ras-related protein Rab-1C [Drosophila mauritiana]|uniref:Ras-related protein Rab-1C n=1 Tax=Drosophila mauritiana TaxID=7226 RepID=A0A6P8KL64_DROMA|nr:ras-related protein Rab-1C [Drosophila mauritiana]
MGHKGMEDEVEDWVWDAAALEDWQEQRQLAEKLFEERCRSCLPVNQCAHPTTEPLNHRTTSEPASNCTTMCVLIVGDTGVGKSSLMMRFTENKFLENYMCTVGMNIRASYVELLEGKMMLEVWDTTGDERLKSKSDIIHRI